MAKLYSLTKILQADDAMLDKGKVFDATPEQAKAFDALGAARPATDDEIKAAKAEADHANGVVA